MADGKQKLVMVPGTGVVAFPGDMEDEHVAAAIRAFRSQKAADQASQSHPLNRPQPLMTEQGERQRQTKQAQPLSSAIPHLPAWLNTPSSELGRQAGNWLSGEIGKALGTTLPDIDPTLGAEQTAEQFRQAHPIAGGVAHGISDIANGLTSPAGAALLMTAPESKVMSALFATQALHGAYKDARAARQAYEQGNNEEATRYATESILSGAMGLAAGAHAVRPELGPQGEVLPPEAKPGPEFPALGSPTPVTLEGKTGGFALPEYDEAPIANYQLIYKSPAADPLELNAVVQELVNARESRGWSDPNASDEEVRKAQQRFYAAADRLGQLRQKAVGQIRQIPSGEKIVYLTEAGLQDLAAGLRGRAPDPEYSLNGVSIAGRYIPIVQANLAALKTPHSKELTKLLSMGAGPDGTVTVSAIPNKNENLSNALSRLREELNHGWQKQFSDQMGNHLPAPTFRSLNGTIPDAMSSYLQWHGYPEDSGDSEANRMRVLEASAKMMSGAPSEFGLTPDEAANYLFQYFDAVTRQHGPQALDELVHTTTLARNIKKDYANARYPSRGSQGQGTVSGLPAGGQGRAQESIGAPGRGTAPVTGPPAKAGAASPSLAALRDEAALRRPSPVPSQTANLSYVSADESQPFYLKSDQIIDQKMKGPMNGPQVLQMLRNNGVKEDELETTGLSDLLSEDRKFTPEEVKEFAAANPVQIEEVQLGGPQLKGWTQQDSERLDELERRRSYLTDEEEEEFQRLVDRENAVSEPGGSPKVTKYGQYTEPGGENYRELLVTIPGAGKGPAQVAYDNFVRNMQRKYLNEGQWAQKISASEEAERQRLSAAVRNEREGESSFRSPHWPDHPNVLVHIRANDRTLPDGRKALHVEEIQSDWAQKGRKEGFVPSPKVARTIPLKAEHKDGYWEVTTGDGRFVTNAYEGEAPTEETAIALARYRLEHEPRRTGFGGAVPAMPFAKTWHELALRRILKYAVDHGYAGVSWTPGEKQAARYDLSKQVNRIAVIPTTGGNRAVRIEPKDGSSIKLMVDKEGTVTPAFSSDDQFAGRNIADVVGKDVADKIMAADKETNLTGLDLKVGGEGMHGFYDKIVPDYLNKIGKRFGAKVGTAATNLQALAKPVYRYEGPELTPEGIKALYNEIKEGKRPDTELAAGTNFVNRSKLSSTLSYIYGEMIDHGLSYNDAVSKTLANSQPLIENFAKEMGGEAVKKTHQTVKFPFLPITPEMRSAFGEPMALFNQTRKPQGTAGSGKLNDLMEEAKRRAPGGFKTATGQTVRIVSDDDPRLARNKAAAIFDRKTGEILVKREFANNQHLLNHEIGHALYEPTTVLDWEPVFRENPEAWQEFRETSTGKSHAKRYGGVFGQKIPEDKTQDPDNPRNYDWKEAAADLYMERQAGKLDDKPELRKVMDSLLPKSAATPEFARWFGDSKVVDPEGKPIVVYHGTQAGQDFSEFSTEGRQSDEMGEYSTSGSGADPTAYMGAHFAQEPHVANKFATGSGASWLKSRYEAKGVAGPRVMPAFLSIKKPMNFGAESNMRDYIYRGKLEGYAGDELLNRAMEADGVDPDDDEDAAHVEWMDKYDNDPDFRAEQNQWVFESMHHQEGEDELADEAAADLARQAKDRLRSQGYDGIRYKNEVEGGTSWIAFDPEQVKSAIGNRGTFDPTNPDITMNQTRKRGAPDGENRNKPFLPNPWREKLEANAKAGGTIYTNNPELLEKNSPKDIWFHGTQADFDQFKTSGIERGTRDWNSQLGVHFTSHSSVANEFAKGLYGDKEKGGRVIQAKLRMANPKKYDLEGDMSDDAVRLAYKHGIITAQDFRNAGNYELARELESGADIDKPNLMYHDGGSVLQKAGRKRPQIARIFANHLKSQGYDGIVYGNTVEGFFGNEAAIVFDPEQIEIVDDGRPKGDVTMNQVRATKETARPSVQALMAEALRRRPSQPTLSEVTKDIAARAPSVVP